MPDAAARPLNQSARSFATRSLPATTEVAVLGGGPAGVGAAYRLARSGTATLVLERGDQLGGLAASHLVGGMPVDTGSHRLHAATDPAVLATLRELLGDELQLRRRNGRARLGGRWVRFPLRPDDLLHTLPASFLAQAGASALRASARSRDTTTFASYVRTGLGDLMAREFYGPYATKIWGRDPDELSGEQARRRISADSPWRLARTVLSAGNDGRRWFRYPTGGFGRITEVLAEAADTAGAAIATGTEVTRLTPEGQSWLVETSRGEVRARQVWSTLPVSVLARLAGLRRPDGGPLPRLPTRAMVVVHLVVPLPSGGAWTPFDAHYLPGADTPVTRVSEPRNYRDSPTDPTDRTVLTAELPCSLGDDLWQASDEELVAIVVETLRAAELPAAPVAEAVVRRVPSAYPVYPVGIEPQVEAVLAAVESRLGLLTFGRQGLFAHDNTHHALAMAWAAADCRRPDGGIDEAAWARARARFAEHVVQD